MQTTTIFKSGNSQCVRIPKNMRLDSKEVYIRKTEEGLLITPISRDPWDAFWKDNETMGKDFFPEGRDTQSRQIRRDLDDLFT